MGRSLSKFATERALIDRMASSRAAAVPWRSVAAAAVLTVLFGLALVGNAHATLVPDGLLAGESGESHFGQSVALSAGGNTALVGAPTAAGEAGAVRVLTRTGSTWTQQAELTPKAGEEVGSGGFGSSVALSAEGSTAVIGAPGDNGGVGAVWVFTRSESGAWTQQGGKLMASGEEGAGQFGRSVALSSKGDAALIGGPGDTGNVGAAWVFTLSGETWTQQGTKLTGTSESGTGEFGRSVALSKVGTTALIGAPGDSSKAGAAWVFTSSSEGAWSQQGEKLTGAGESGAGELGRSVGLSAEGNTALVGGPADSTNVGAAWVYTRSEAGAWSQQGEKLTGSAETGEGSFGSSIALSADGEIALVGGSADNTNAGAAWLFTRSQAGAWTLQGEKLTGSEETGEGQFGGSVALASDGNTALVGGPADNTNTGAAWAFVNPPTVSNVTPNEGPEAGGTSVTITGTNFNEAAGVEFGSTGATSFEVISPTSIAAIAPAGAGTVDVSVTTSGGTSATSTPDKFSYVPAPTVVTKAASSIAQTTATLNATVDPNGGEVSSCKFEYGTAEPYETSVPCSTLPGSGTEPVAVSAALENLSANTTYQFRIVATNLGGTSTDILTGETFKTLPNAPTIVTEAASALAQTTATLNATVNPNGGEVTSCEFDYGTSEAYGKSIPCSSLPGSGSSPAAVSAAPVGLSADTTYHFRIVATNAGGTSTAADQTFETLPDAPTVMTKVASSVSQTSATLNATVNPNGGTVTTCHFDYGTTIGYGHEMPCFSLPGSGASPAGVSASVTGLGANTTYHFRIVATNAGGTSTGGDQTFETLPDAPTVVTGAASSLTQTSATLNATVNPNGGEVTNCEFDYGTSGAYGKSAPCSPLPGFGTSAVAVSAAVTGLSANTTYHFRVITENAGGASSGSDQTLKTLPDSPTVVTKAASSIRQTTATLNATVNPNGGEVTSCELDYGTSQAYGESVPCSSSPGSGSGSVAVSASLQNLSANTTYHFRIVATNAGGTSTGADQTFETLPDAPTVVTGAASSLTQTSATLNATVNPNGGVVGVGECRLEYGTTSAYGHAASCSSLPGSATSAVAVSAAVIGLSANTTYHFRVVAENAGGASSGSDQTFDTLPNPPAVVTEKASSITQTAASLNATVNPNGGSVADCRLEYGTSTSYGSSVSCAPPPGSVTSAVAVSAAVTGLSANTTYHFRIVATNAGGTGTGGDGTFETLPNPPTVVTGSGSSVTQTTVTLNATVNPNNGEVGKCYFEYGETVAYGDKAPCAVSPGSSASPVAVSASVTGLIKNTTYHFRIVAANAGGTSPGADQTFETAPGPPTVVAGEASAIGQTSAVLIAEINPNGGVVTQCYFHYENLTSQQLSITPCVGLPLSGKSPGKVSALAEGLSANTRYSVSLEVLNSFGEAAFGEAGTPFETLPGPEVVTGAASMVTQTSATLNATVNPNGGEVSSCAFEYGTSESYGSTPIPCESHAGAGKKAVLVSAKLQGLSANTKYFFRIVATNPGGTSKDTRGQTLTTLPNAPAAVTGEATSVTQTSVSVNATVNENGGRASDCHFEYGPTSAYGASVPCMPSPGAEKVPVAVSATLANLSPNVTYHVRIVAANPGGTGTGEDKTFATTPDAPTLLTGAVSSVTQTSATLNATVNPNGGEVTSCEFDYGTAEVYGKSAPCSALPGAGNGPVAVSAPVGSLRANMTYQFRVLATNRGGASVGVGQAFMTASAASMLTTAPSTTPSTTTPSTTTSATPTATQATSCRTSLASMTVAVQGEGTAAVKLSWIGTGTDTCSGKLMLRVKVKGRNQRPKTMLIGTGSFSLSVGGMQVARLKLDGVGRALLSAAHGRLSASLAILQLLPGPPVAQTQAVQLARAARASARSARSARRAHD
jgi:phosphodiesterase/alkaline phosphatase D-like protein